MAEHFGEHLMIDGYGGSERLLNDQAVVAKALNELPSMLDMNILAAPVVYHAPATGKKDPGGWSGFVVIAESHISIHTFPKRGFVSVDVYTCKNGLDVDMVKQYVAEQFALADLEVNFTTRGTRYPAADIY